MIQPNKARVIGIVGGPESGKTQLALRILNQLRRHAAWVCAHDPNSDMPEYLHDGTRIPLHRVDSTARVLYRIKTSGFRQHPAPIPVLESPSPTRLVRELMKLSTPEAPGVVLIDEMGAWKQAKARGLGDLLADVIARRRHTNLTVLWGAQFLGQIHYSVITQSNYIVCSRVTDAWALQRLKQGGASKPVLDLVQVLPEWTFVTIPILGKGFEPAELPNSLDVTRLHTD